MRFEAVQRSIKHGSGFHRKVLQRTEMSGVAFAQGACINAFDESGWTALHYSLCLGIFVLQRDNRFISFLLTCTNTLTVSGCQS